MITAMLRSTISKSCNYSPLKVNIVIEVVNDTVGVAVSNTVEISGLIGSSIISSIPHMVQNLVYPVSLTFIRILFVASPYLPHFTSS